MGLTLRARWAALPRFVKVGTLVTGCVLVLFIAFLAGASIPVLGFLASLLGLLIPFLSGSAAAPVAAGPPGSSAALSSNGR